MRPGRDLHSRIAVLQTAALLLGYQAKSERRELDPLPSPWQGDVLPMNYSRIKADLDTLACAAMNYSRIVLANRRS